VYVPQPCFLATGVVATLNGATLFCVCLCVCGVGRTHVESLSDNTTVAILGSRFVPTTSASKSRPSSPLILPAIPVPTLEETIAEEHGIPHGTFTPPHTDSTTPPSTESPSTSTQSSSLPTLQRQAILQEDASESQNQKRTTLDHSGVTIPWTIDTKYYSVQVDFWIDETDVQGRAELERMVASGELDEMGSVVEAVIFCFSRNQVGELGAGGFPLFQSRMRSIVEQWPGC